MIAAIKPQKPSLSLDPLTNRGSGCLDLLPRIDWVQGIIPLHNQGDLDAILRLVMLPGDQVLRQGEPTHSGKQWEHHGVTAYHLWYAWDDPTHDQPGKLLLVLPGSCLSFLSAEQVYLLLQSLVSNWGFRATRLDFAVDDFAKGITPAQVAQAGREGNFGRFRRKPRIVEDAETGGMTVTFGHRLSDKELRVYDKFVESDGEIDAVRWELEMKDRVADAHLAEFLACRSVDAAYQFVAGAVFGCIEFRDRGDGDRRLDRCPLLPWWEQMLGRVSQIRLPVPRPKRTIKRTLAWILNQVAPTFAILAKLWGLDEFDSFVNHMVDYASQNLSSQSRAFLEVLRAEQISIA